MAWASPWSSGLGLNKIVGSVLESAAVARRELEASIDKAMGVEGEDEGREGVDEGDAYEAAVPGPESTQRNLGQSLEDEGRPSPPVRHKASSQEARPTASAPRHGDLSRPPAGSSTRGAPVPRGVASAAAAAPALPGAHIAPTASLFTDALPSPASPASSPHPTAAASPFLRAALAAAMSDGAPGAAVAAPDSVAASSVDAPLSKGIEIADDTADAVPLSDVAAHAVVPADNVSASRSEVAAAAPAPSPVAVAALPQDVEEGDAAAADGWAVVGDDLEPPVPPTEAPPAADEVPEPQTTSSPVPVHAAAAYGCEASEEASSPSPVPTTQHAAGASGLQYDSRDHVEPPQDASVADALPAAPLEPTPAAAASPRPSAAEEEIAALHARLAAREAQWEAAAAASASAVAASRAEAASLRRELGAREEQLVTMSSQAARAMDEAEALREAVAAAEAALAEERKKGRAKVDAGAGV